MALYFIHNNKLNAIAINYFDSHIIEVPLELTGNDITNVDGLDVLTSIKATLKIDER